jgi:hypothetical protein
MRSARRFLVALLLSTAAFAQRHAPFGGGFRGDIGFGSGRGSWGIVNSGFPGRAVIQSTYRGPAGHRLIIGAALPAVPTATAFPFSTGLPSVSTMPSISVNTINPAFAGAGFAGRDFKFSRGFRNHYSPFYWPFFPVIEDYGQAYPVTVPNNVYIIAGPDAPSPAASSPESAKPVIHEYKWPNERSVPSEERITFTIALKDGSKHSALATWVQKQSLYYVDSEGRQQVLASELIDYEVTMRLNEEKKLIIHLPS